MKGKKRWATGLVAGLLATSMALPAFAESVSELQEQLKQLKKQQEEVQAKQNQAKQEAQQLKGKKQDVTEQIAALDQQIAQTEAQLQQVQKQVSQTKRDLEKARAELEEAEKRVEERSELLKTRVRLMYTKSGPSYLEVLFSSDSFADFLAKARALQMIAAQDRAILEQNKADRDMIAQKEQEIAEHLATLQAQEAEVSKLRTRLDRERQQKRTLLKQIEQQIVEMELIEEEQRQALLALARQQSALQAKIVEAQRRDASLASRKARGTYVWPVPGYTRVSSDFGWRTHPITGDRRFHAGIDLAAPQGSAILAAEDGVVLVAQYVNGYGNTVIIDHGGGVWTLYAHIRNGGTMVKPGEVVSAGQKIAEVGSTGNSTGPHLHFEVVVNGEPQNPWNYIR